METSIVVKLHYHPLEMLEATRESQQSLGL